MEKKRMPHQQRTLNFDPPASAERTHVAETTSQPPPHQLVPLASSSAELAADAVLGPIRLACRYCDRDDHDYVDTLPSDWHDVHDVQTLEESLRPADPADAKSSVLDWFTHVGVCPDCHDALDGPAAAFPPLVRPDRQLTYDGSDPCEWPHVSTVHDANTISVDRLTADIDGPPHRFLIRRGDQVEVHWAPDKFPIGIVVEIDHRREEVQVQFPGSSQRYWFYKIQVYPTASECPTSWPTDAPRPAVRDEANGERAAVLPDNTPQAAPYTFAEFKAFHAEQPVTYERFQTEFHRIWESQDALRAELVSHFKAAHLKRLAAGFGGVATNRATKEQNAASIVQRMLAHFVLDGTVRYSPLSGETYEHAVRQKVESFTAGEYYRHFEEQQAKSLAKEQALADPQNLADFHAVIETKGEDAFTDEQLARYDALRADLQRGLRAAQKTNRTVQQFQSDELKAISFIRKEGYHDKRQCPLTIVQLESRVERDAFNELNRKAKQLGGWYSSFKKSDAGFQFLEASQADRFCALLSGDADRTDVLAARKERRELSAAEALHELATSLAERAEESIDRSNESLQNTARRADIQAGVRGRAYVDLALSRTMHSLAEALSRGEAKYLDGIRHKTQLETLETMLYRAQWERIRAVKKLDNESGHGLRQERLEEEPVSLATIRFVEFPHPTIYRRNLDEAIASGLRTTGVKQAAAKLKKYLRATDAEYVEFAREHQLDALFDFLARAKTSGIDVERITLACEHYQRLVRGNITSLPELRAALREYLEHRAERRGDDPVKIAERELIGKDLPGFFPTPRPVIERMLVLAQIENQHRVLEPSCGKGDILDAIREQHPDVELHAIERNYTLAEVLAAKGHTVEFADFLDHQGSYDRILMNPPFENSQDAEHVQHAYTLLAPGGRLVSVMCEGPFFRSDVKSVAFRDWLAAVGGETEELPVDAFQGKEAFRETGVRTRLVTITKGGI